MTDIELKQLEEKLWHSADLLRAGAHISATSYGEPIFRVDIFAICGH